MKDSQLFLQEPKLQQRKSTNRCLILPTNISLSHCGACCTCVQTQRQGRELGLLLWGKRVNRRPLEKGCGKREREAEGVGPYKEQLNTTQALSCLSVPLTQTSQETPNSPCPYTHSPSLTTLFFTLTHSPAGCAHSVHRGWLCPCGEWMGSGEGWLEFWCSALCCSAVSTLIIIN